MCGRSVTVLGSTACCGIHGPWAGDLSIRSTLPRERTAAVPRPHATAAQCARMGLFSPSVLGGRGTL
jgi:hypothetical protein